MEAVKSPMCLKDFAIIETELKFSPYADDTYSIKPDETMSQWIVDIDFDIQSSIENNLHNIETQVRINMSDKPGYNINVTGVGLFVFDQPTSPEELHKFLFFSGVSICIASIRAYIANITSYGILGKYTIPTIDMPTLLQSKVKELESKISNS